MEGTEDAYKGTQTHVLVQKQLEDVILTQQAAYDKLRQSVSIVLAELLSITIVDEGVISLPLVGDIWWIIHSDVCLLSKFSTSDLPNLMFHYSACTRKHIRHMVQWKKCEI